VVIVSQLRPFSPSHALTKSKDIKNVAKQIEVSNRLI